VPSLSFLNSAFLWALPLAAIPIIIHLLSRRRLPEVAFPTTQFLRQLEPREIRRLRLRELLLLLLRTLAILLLALAFARPTLTPRNTVTHAAAAVAILVDDSQSMAALDDRARPRIQAARERAAAILDAGRSGDEMYLLTTTRPEAGTAEGTADRVRLTRSLGQVEATALPARMPEALEAARRTLERSALQNRELYLISDFQRSNFDERTRSQIQAASGAAHLYVVPLVESRVPNHAFVEVDPLLKPGPQNRGMELRARIANHADAPTDRLAIRIRRGDALIGGGDVTLRADETRWVAMPVDWRSGEARDLSGPVLIEADEDALSPDDHWFAVLGAPGRLRVLRITEARDGASGPRFSALALDPGRDGRGGFSVEDGSPASLLSLHRNRADVVLLEDVASISGDAESRLREFLRQGGGLVVAMGPHSDPGYYGNRLFPGIIDLAVEGAEQATAGGSFEIRARLPGHGILEGLAVDVGSPLTQSRLTGLMRARALSPRTEVVVQTTGGLPLVAAAPGVSVFLSSLSEDWGDLPYSGSFVPLVRGLVSHAARAAQSSTIGPPRVGEPPRARLDAPPSSALTVRGPGAYLSQASVRAEGVGYLAVADAPAIEPGFYEFEAGGRPLATVAVNLDPTESDLAPLPPDSLRAASGGRATLLSTARALTTHLEETRRGRELWIPLLLIAALALVGELLLGSARALKA
jgi:Aerotolerance regulator N-terminal/von Willebrand factor type A domain